MTQSSSEYLAAQERLRTLEELIPLDEFLEFSDFEKYPLTAVELETMHSERFQNAAFRLGQIGVIIPYRMEKEDVYRFSMAFLALLTTDEPYKSIYDSTCAITKEEYEEEVCDVLFEYLYSKSDSWYFRDMRNKVLDDIQYDDLLMDRLSQAFLAYDQELFFPCACSLMALLEGVLGNYASSGSTKLYELTNILSSDKQVLFPVASANLKGFISELAKSAHFVKDSEPIRLNRHWLLHGRSRKTIGKIDCIRLLCAFQLIIELLSSSPNTEV